MNSFPEDGILFKAWRFVKGGVREILYLVENGG